MSLPVLSSKTQFPVQKLISDLSEMAENGEHKSKESFYAQRQFKF